MSTPNPPSTSKKPSLITTAIPPINREPVELDGTPTSPHYGSRISIIGGGGHRLPRADTLDRNSTGTQSATTTTTTTPGSALSDSVDRIGAAAIAEADIEGARVGAGVDEAALRMNGQAVGNREGEEDGDQEEDEEVGGVLREVSWWFLAFLLFCLFATKLERESGEKENRKGEPNGCANMFALESFPCRSKFGYQFGFLRLRTPLTRVRKLC